MTEFALTNWRPKRPLRWRDWRLWVQVRLEFKLADLWVGVFPRWTGRQLHVWLCLLPCLPLHFCFEIGRRRR